MKNEDIVAKAFGKQSKIFDQIYDSNPIVNYMREIIRNHVMNRAVAGSKMLEVNAGTGTDAIFFGQRGFRVLAGDISAPMVEKAQAKITSAGLSDRVTFKRMGFDELDTLKSEYDYVYSNFGGLNCIPNIAEVVSRLHEKLCGGGQATLVIMPPFSLWEKLHVLKANWKVAFRRKFRSASSAHIEGEYFSCWYHDPFSLRDHVKTLGATEIDLMGLCVLVPPSFMRNFPSKLPRVYRALIFLDRKICRWPIFNRIGDYYILSFTKS
ncbi:MAG: class I SAM-dependent methyltransferase [Marinoscillum sp.]|uniref:class I SAM-dependent methyltransferase n=1 Tax=Marinoscillum sp. TaxID=2024838 RepID=UPI0032F2A082